jgi:hypothetical protein
MHRVCVSAGGPDSGQSLSVRLHRSVEDTLTWQARLRNCGAHPIQVPLRQADMEDGQGLVGAGGTHG